LIDIDTNEIYLKSPSGFYKAYCSKENSISDTIGYVDNNQNIFYEYSVTWELF
jgi:hypothetical protein